LGGQSFRSFLSKNQLGTGARGGGKVKGKELHLSDDAGRGKRTLSGMYLSTEGVMADYTPSVRGPKTASKKKGVKGRVIERKSEVKGPERRKQRKKRWSNISGKEIRRGRV